MGLRERRINRIKFEDIVNEAETIDDRSEYISNGDKAVELIAGLISSSCDTKQNSINEIDKQIDDLFSLYSDITLENELEHYRRMKVLCARLKEQQKISNKVVVGFGGQFSAGKSAFINAICGLDHVLPEAQKPTTSLPTYIIRNSDPSYKETIFSATTNRGMTVPLDVQKMKALTHEFHKEYGIGFSSFIESITVESPQYNLPANIALLDTPGYSKFDNKADSKQVFSDREKAERQLRTAKYLIWLVDIENGVVKQEDIKFLKELKVEAPILVVLNKADKKTQNEIDSIIEVCQQTIDNNGIPCMGIAAYSARECKEYTNGIISKFFNEVSNNHVEELKQDDVRKLFIKTEKQLYDSIIKYKDALYNEKNSLWQTIKTSNRFIDVTSISEIWGRKCMNFRKIKNITEETRNRIYDLNRNIDILFGDHYMYSEWSGVIV